MKFVKRLSILCGAALLTLGALSVPAGAQNFVDRVRPPTWDMIATAPANNADFNSDGKVDGTDFLIWQKGFGLSGQTGKTNGNANTDAVVDGADFAVWKSKFGGAPAGASGGAVPEPAACSLVAIALASYAARRRSR